MRSLFTKILLWFVLTVVVTFFGSVIIAELSWNEFQSPPARLVSFPAAEARRAFEERGKAGLSVFLVRFRDESRGEGVLTDAEGRDLITGKNWMETIRKEHAHRAFWLGPRVRPSVFVRRFPDGKYWWLQFSQERGGAPPPWLIAPQRLWMLGVIVLLCYGFALHLTFPLRQLQKTLERFGQGDFAARTNSKRRDELGQLARTFDKMAERIQTLLAAERRLLQDISHELRSPLARLGVAVELARSGENRDSALDRIEKESVRLNSLVGELLQVTRAEGDASSLHKEPVRLDELLETVVEDCSVEARARACSVQFETPQPVTITGDPELLRRATENIIRNAVRFAPRDTPVKVELERSNGTALIRVRDTGPGVPQESLGRIFDPFYRVETDRNRTSGGVGLGLSIARRAVELHHGKIHAKNANPGLTVEMELPVSEEPASGQN